MKRGRSFPSAQQSRKVRKAPFPVFAWEGIKIARIDFAALQDILRNWLRSPNNVTRVVVTINPEAILLARRQKRFRVVLRKADLAVCDGVGISFLARLAGAPFPVRITGYDVIFTLAGLCAELRATMFLAGGAKGVAARAASALRKRFEGLRIAYYAPAHQWRPELPPDFLRALRESKASVAVLAYGMPRQELWCARLQNCMPGLRVCVGVGGVLDVLAGRLPRAPRWCQLLGLEWCWRLACEPRRMPRILRAVVQFPLHAGYINFRNHIRSIYTKSSRPHRS
jgi:N-acetylglucosaminyldiphosphoundecaprenol N-acetyl-beta-D-mannosaminyltransferase